MGTGSIRRLGRGRPRLKPDRVAGDKAYSSGKIREALRRRGIGAVIPTKENERRQPDFDRQAYRERNRIERLINRLKQFRRIATRYEKRAVNYLAMQPFTSLAFKLRQEPGGDAGPFWRGRECRRCMTRDRRGAFGRFRRRTGWRRRRRSLPRFAFRS